MLTAVVFVADYVQEYTSDAESGDKKSEMLDDQCTEAEIVPEICQKPVKVSLVGLAKMRVKIGYI